MPRYKRPRKVNLVSLLLLLFAAGGIYAAVQFGPAYYRKWRAHEVLGEAANKFYPLRMVSGGDEAEAQQKIEREAVQALRQMGIKDPGLQVRIYKTPSAIKVNAVYQEVVRHPLVRRTTTLFFRPETTLTIRSE